MLGWTSCSFFKVEIDPFIDLPALDAHILNTRDWLHYAQEEYEAFQPLLKEEQAVNIKKKFKIYQRLKALNLRMGQALSDISNSLEKQKNMALQLKGKPGLVFIDSTSGKFHPLLDSLVANKQRIRQSQSVYESAKIKCIRLFKKPKKRLVFIRDQVKPWQNEVAELALKRHEIRESMIQFEHTLGEAVFQQENELYKKNISDLSRRLNKRIKALNRFEKNVNHMIRIAKKEVGAFVYKTPINDPKKEYENRFEQDLIHYKETLNELKKTFESL